MKCMERCFPDPEFKVVSFPNYRTIENQLNYFPIPVLYEKGLRCCQVPFEA